MNAPTCMLAIDVGNTLIKVGEFAGPPTDPNAGPIRVLRVSSAAPDWDELQAWLVPQPAAAFLISVCPPASDRLAAWFRRQLPNCPFRQLQRVDFPLQVHVDAPDRVGHDRLAAAVAAQELESPGASGDCCRLRFGRHRRPDLARRRLPGRCHLARLADHGPRPGRRYPPVALRRLPWSRCGARRRGVLHRKGDCQRPLLGQPGSGA